MPTYEEWMEEIDQLITANLGIGLDDLDDYRYADAYEDGLSPGETAMEVLENDELYRFAVEEGLVDL